MLGLVWSNPVCAYHTSRVAASLEVDCMGTSGHVSRSLRVLDMIFHAEFLINYMDTRLPYGSVEARNVEKVHNNEAPFV